MPSRRERVGDVEAPRQREFDAHARRAEGRADGAHRHVVRHQIGARVAGRGVGHERLPAFAQLAGPSAPVRIVEVDHRRGREVEEAPLRGRIGLHRLVEIEMIAGEVRECRDRELDVVDPRERERVRADFHRDRVRAGVAQTRELPWSSSASGVVFASAVARSRKRVPSVPITAHGKPPASSTAAAR